MKNILLVNPPTGKYIRGEDRCQVPVEDLTATVARMPLDLAYIGATLQNDGYSIHIRDYPAEDKDKSNFYFDLINLKPDLLLISTTMFSLLADIRLLTFAKQNNQELITIIKGVSADYWKSQILSQYNEVDGILSGEYELTLLKFLKMNSPEIISGITYKIGSKIYHSVQEPLIDDLNSLPFPARNLLNNNLYLRPDTNEPITTLQTSRGCPHQCIYCLAPIISGHKVRYRSTTNLIEEIEECIKKYGIKNFFFRADTFTLNKKWVKELTSEIIKRNLKIKYAINSRTDTLDEELIKLLKISGCFLISLGIESGSERSLELMKKGINLKQSFETVNLIKKYHIKLYLFFMIGFPWETKEDILKTIDYAIKLNGDFVEFHNPVPFEKTELREMFIKESLLQKELSLNTLQLSDHATTKIGTKYLSMDDLLKLRKYAILKYYLRPKYLLTILYKIRSVLEFKNYLKYGFERIIRLIFKKL